MGKLKAINVVEVIDGDLGIRSFTSDAVGLGQAIKLFRRLVEEHEVGLPKKECSTENDIVEYINYGSYEDGDEYKILIVDSLR